MTGFVKITIVQNNISKYAFNELRIKLFSWIVHHELKTIEMTLRDSPRSNLVADILLCDVDEDEFWNLEREFKRTRGDHDYKRKYADNIDFEILPDIVMKE